VKEEVECPRAKGNGGCFELSAYHKGCLDKAGNLRCPVYKGNINETSHYISS
jgi:hypothetical protein